MGRVPALGALGVHMVLGLGIAQMSEYMLRPSPAAVGSLLRIAVSRSRAARALLRAARPYRIVLSPDPKANVRVLSDFLEADRAASTA